MKATGIVRKVDELGRVVIPIELRRTLFFNDTATTEIYTDEDRIVLRKYEPTCTCIFCGSVNDVSLFKGRNVCKKCARDLQKEAV